MVHIPVFMLISLAAIIGSSAVSSFPIRNMARRSFWNTLYSDNPQRLFYKPLYEILVLVMFGGLCYVLPGTLLIIMSIPVDNVLARLGFLGLFWFAGVAMSFLFYETAQMDEERRYIDAWYELHPNVARK